LEKLGNEIGPENYRQTRYEEAAEILRKTVLSPDFIEFTPPIAYDML